MSPEMYILIDSTPFHLNIAPTTLTPAYQIKHNLEGVMVPYTHKEKSTIDAKYSMVKNYFETWKTSILHAMTLLMHTSMMRSRLHCQLTRQPQDGMQ
jgi:hypothetical protein